MNMSNSTSNFTNSSMPIQWHGNLATQILTVEIILHILACLVLTVFGMIIKRAVPLEHPIYALLHLESVGLATLHAMFCIFFTYLLINNVEMSRIQPYTSLVYQWGQQFHQIVWLCLTMLRYYFLVYLKNKDIEVDMKKLARRSKQFVLWSTAALILALLVYRDVVAFLLFGTTNYEQIVPIQGPTKTAFVAALVAGANSMDLISIAIYLYMRKSLSETIQPANSTESPSHESNVQHNNDIHVISRNVSEDNDMMADMNNVEGQISFEDGNPSPDLNVSPPPATTMDHKAKQEAAVAMALEMHVMSSLIDALIPLLGLLSMKSRLIAFIPPTMFMTSLWPMILAIRTHSKLRSMMKQETKELLLNIYKYAI